MAETRLSLIHSPGWGPFSESTHLGSEGRLSTAVPYHSLFVLQPASGSHSQRRALDPRGDWERLAKNQIAMDSGRPLAVRYPYLYTKEQHSGPGLRQRPHSPTLESGWKGQGLLADSGA